MQLPKRVKQLKTGHFNLWSNDNVTFVVAQTLIHLLSFLSFFFVSNQLLLANKATNGSTSGQALVAPAPPSYEEATAGITAHFFVYI